MITDQDLREIAKFKEFLRAVSEGKSAQEAFADLYGEVVFVVEETSNEQKRPL